MAKRNKNAEEEVDLEGEIPESEEDTARDIVSNAADVPLFAGAGFANNRSISKLKLVKLDNPGAGYKGEIPNNSTLETIGQLFGDGLYNIEAVNGRGMRLRTLENQRIALGFSPHDSGGKRETTNVVAPTTDVDRIERLALKSANESVIQATAFRDLVVATTTASAARDREFMQGVLAQQSQAAAQQAQTAAQNASQQQAFLLQAFTQQMAQQQAAHTQMLEALGVMRRNDGDAEGSAERLMAIFMQGMQMGRGMELGEEQPFWQEILKGGMGLLGSVREKQLAGTANPALPAPAKGKSSPPKLNRLLKAMRSRGIDTDRLIDMLERGAPSPTSESEDGPEEPESDSDSEDVEPQGPIFTSS